MSAHIRTRIMTNFLLGLSFVAPAGCASLRATSCEQTAALLAHRAVTDRTPDDSELHAAVAAIDRELRASLDIDADDTAIGLFDLRSARFAFLRGDTPFYAASVPKIAILLAWFDTRPEAAAALDEQTRHELGLMIKRSSNEMAARYSEMIGLEEIGRVLQADRYRLYEAERDGGLWVGKHYSKDSQRLPDPVCGLSHAATARQLIRYFLMLERGELVSPVASAAMRDIFDSPDIEHTDTKFVKGLVGRNLHILRKSGTWDVWHGDVARIAGEDRTYLLAALVHHPKGEEYCVALAARIDDLLGGAAPSSVDPPAAD